MQYYTHCLCLHAKFYGDWFLMWPLRPKTPNLAVFSTSTLWLHLVGGIDEVECRCTINQYSFTGRHVKTQDTVYNKCNTVNTTNIESLYNIRARKLQYDIRAWSVQAAGVTVCSLCCVWDRSAVMLWMVVGRRNAKRYLTVVQFY